MGNIEQPPVIGEIPHPFGVMPLGGVINEPGAFGVIWQPFGDVSTGPPCRGVTGMQGYCGDLEIGP